MDVIVSLVTSVVGGVIAAALVAGYLESRERRRYSIRRQLFLNETLMSLADCLNQVKTAVADAGAPALQIGLDDADGLRNWLAAIPAGERGPLFDPRMAERFKGAFGRVGTLLNRLPPQSGDHSFAELHALALRDIDHWQRAVILLHVASPIDGQVAQREMVAFIHAQGAICRSCELWDLARVEMLGGKLVVRSRALIRNLGSRWAGIFRRAGPSD